MCSTDPAAALVTVGGDVHRSVLGQDHPGDAGALGRAQQRAQVAGVGDAIAQQQERRRGAGAGPEQVVERDVGQGAGERDHALGRVGAGDGVELAPTHHLHQDARLTGQLADVVEHRRGVEVRGHPDLAGGATVGEQQLPHGLAAFDLLAAETLLGRGARLGGLRPHGHQGVAGVALTRARRTALAALGRSRLGRAALAGGRAAATGRGTAARRRAAATPWAGGAR